MNKLKPCPFCGIEMTRTRAGKTIGHKDLTGCFLDGCVFSDDAIPLWNKRVKTMTKTVSDIFQEYEESVTKILDDFWAEVNADPKFVEYMESIKDILLEGESHE